MLRSKILIPPLSILLFLALVLAGIYVVRRHILEQHVAAAMAMKDMGTVRQLLDEWPSPANARLRDGCPMLCWAVMERDEDLIRLLMKRGARSDARMQFDICSTDPPEPFTPLQVAVYNGDHASAEVLLEGGADVEKKTVWYTYNDPKMTEILLSHGADINATDPSGYTQLHWAAFHSDSSVVRILLAKGAAVNAKNKKMETPLHLAARCGWNEGVQMLLSSGADVDAVDNSGMTPLAWAKKSRPPDTLVGASAQRNAYDRAIDLLRQHGAKE